MAITAQLADGRILEFPDGTDPAVIQSTVKRIIAESQPQGGAGFSLGDLAASFMQGAYGSTQALTDVFGAGNVASQALEERARASQAGMSLARQAELARQQERAKKAEESGSTWEEVKAAIQSVAEAPLQSAAQAVGSFVPYLPTMFLGPAAAGLGLGARATAAATAVSRAAPAAIGTAQGAGAVKGAIYDAVYEAEIKDGLDPEQARAKAIAAQEFAGENIDQIATGAGLGYVAGRFGAERLLTPGAAAAASRSMAGRIGTAVATDVPTEALQGGQERLAANIALQREGYDVPTFQGVAGQAAQEGLLGLLGAAPIAAVRGPDVEALREQEMLKQAQEFEAEKARALAEEQARPPEPEKPIELPGGFTIQREEVARETVPESFGIFVEGQEEPLTSVPTQEEAQAKLDSFTQIREQERENYLDQIEKLGEEVQKRRDRIDYLEATGQTATEEYQQAKATIPQQEEAAETKSRQLAEQMEQLGRPMTITPMGQREAVQERFNVISPTGKLFETHATQGEAEASVRKLLGEEVFKEAEQKKARDERIVQLEKDLIPAMQKFGLKDVGLKVVEQIENNAGGAYLNKLVRVAYDEPNPLQTMRHESVHALKDLGFFTPQQWKALEERAKKEWIKQYLEGQTTEIDGQQMTRLEGYRKIGYSEEAIVEEAIADAFGAYDKGVKPPPGLIASLFKKLKNFFTNFGQALRGAGFESADDIFQRVERGELKAGKPAEPTGEIKYAAEKAEEKEEKLSLKKPTSDIGHKREATTGRYVGAPDWVGGSPQQLTNLRKKLKALAKEGEAGRYWYENSSKAILELADGDKKEAEKIVSLIAIYSPNATVAANTSMALNAYYQFKTGQPIKAGLPDNNKKAEELLVQGKEWSGIKTNSFYQNLMVEIDPSKLDPGVATMDMWMAIAFDYGMKALDQGPKYKFTEREIQRLAKELGWDAHQVQAAIWTAMKGRVEPIRDALRAEEIKLGIGEMVDKDGKQVYRIKPERRYDHFRLAHKKGMEYNLLKSDIEESKYDFSDAIRERSAQMSWEATPGESTGILPGILKAPTNQKFEYLEAVAKELKDQNGQDIIAKVVGMPGGKTIFGFSAWQGDVGAGAQTYTGVAMQGVGDKRDLTPQSRAILNLYAAIKGYVLSQEAVVYHVPDYNGSTKNQNGIELKFKRALTEDEVAELYRGLNEKFKTWDIAPGYTPTGVRLLNFTKIPNKQFHKGVEEILQSLPESFGDGMMDFVTYRSIGDYIGNDWKEAKNGEQYLEAIASAQAALGGPQRPNLQEWATDVRARIEAVNERFAKKYGWGKAKLAEEESGLAGSAARPGDRGGLVLGPARKEDAVSYNGVHYGKEKVDVLLADKYGTGIRGAERRRLEDAMDPRIKRRVYFYIAKPDGKMPAPEAGLGGNVYKQRFDNILGPGKEMNRLYAEANGDPNQFESLIVDAGYDGYASPSMGMMVILNHDVPVDYLGPKSEVGDLKLSLRAPTTPQFKQWFGNSQIVNEDGTPKVMYHGLAKDTTDFTRKTARGAPIFLTDDPVFAERFAYDSFEGIASNPKKYLTEAQIKDGMRNAIAMVRKDYGKDTFGKEIIDSIKSGDIKNATPEAKEYLGKALKDMLPTGPHVMPLYVRAENPFDYQNPRHIYRLKEEVDLDDDLWRSIREGDWDTIESQEVQDAIQFAGFDSFYVKEHGRKNLAVYDPNQVKSATGNIGTFSRDTSDVRYSLISYPSVKQAQKAADDTPVPETAEFKLYIAGSQWLDDDGKAKKFFHATVGDFFTFQDGVIYLSETAADSEKFGREKEGDLRSRIYRALRKEEKLPLFQRAVDKAVQNGKITEERGEKFMRDAKRSIPEFDRYSSIKEEMDDELMALSPQFMKIMPLYARAMMPFDFNNPDHRDQVVSYIESRTDLSRNVSEDAREQARRLGVPSEFPDEDIKGLRGRLKNGFTTTIEKPQVQKAIRALNFDGFISRKAIGSPLTYAVYKPQQVKSVTGNIGDFSLENKDVRFSLRSVRYTPTRFEDLYNKSMYTNNDNATKGYLGFVQPLDFVRATSNENTLKRLRDEQEPLDFDKMRSLGPIGLVMSKGDGENWKIIGHEGRHRMLALADAGYRDIPVYIEFGSAIEDAQPIPTKNVRAQERDAIDPFLTIAELEPLSYANRDKAIKVFTREQPVKYSLPKMPTALDTRVGETTTRRDPATFGERITKAISPQGFSYFRQKAINRYNQLSVYDRKLVEQMGGKELLADQSAEAAALMSDLGAGVAASAMGVGDRHGGIPVYKNGVTTIDRSKKGLISVLQPLARYGDPKIYQYYQYWAMVKRGVRLNAEGKTTGIDNTDVQYAKYLEGKFPEFVTVQKEFIEFNNGLVKYARDTGVISEFAAQEFMKHADYVPFYRQMDGETTVGPNIFQSIAGIRPPKKLKGGTAPLADFLETAVRNTQSMIQAGMKNAAAQRAVDVVSKVKAPGMGAERLDFDATGPDVFQVLENGKRVSYRTPDHLLLDALSSLHMAELPFMGILSAPANALRNLVTKDPGFMMANLMRDSLSAWVTSGQSMAPVAGTVINFGKVLARKSKGYEALIDAGVIGGYELSQNIERSGQELEDDLAKKAGKKASLPLRPFTSLWEGLEKGTTASDAATRALVYERVMKETGNEAEALFRSLEVMNFNRKGNSPLIRVVTAAVPFLNARIQGLDLFYRASTGNMNMADKKAIQRKFWVRGATMMALSCYYYMLVQDEDDYKSQEQETKDNNWIIPSLGLRIPIPFEVGVLFKTIPERIMAYSFGNDTGQDFMDSMKRNVISTFAFNPIPQTVKPIVEATTNFNFFTWRAIVGQGMQDVAPEFQVGPGTSKIAKAIGESLGLSPMKVDHIIKGYTGTMGMYAIDSIDYIMDQFSDSPKAAKRFEQMPVIKRFAVDPAARGTVTAYYQLKDSVDTTVRTMNLLERSMEPEKFAKYVQDNIGVLAVKDYVWDMEKTMKETREMRQAIQVSPMSAEEKRDALLAITQAENHLTKNIQDLKKAIASVK